MGKKTGLRHSNKRHTIRLLTEKLKFWDNLINLHEAWFPWTKIICHINFDNEFAFTHSKDYSYYLARLSKSDNETSPQN